VSGYAIALLAAGASRRFGPDDKLLAPLGGEPLCRHAARAVMAVPAHVRWAVVAEPGGPVGRCLAEAGLNVIANPEAAAGQGTSVACAARAALEAGVDRLVIGLADMPFVPAAQFEAVARAGRDHDGVMSRAGHALLPPACFQASVLDGLAALSGDRGAGAVFAGLERRTVVDMDAWMASDIDTQADRDAAEQAGLRIDG